MAAGTMISQPFKTRFAPSPTGLLHLGNMRTALFNFLLAQQKQGIFLLRLEDTDAMRGHEKYARALEEDLHWLGLNWTEGPNVGGTLGPYAQSERGSIYSKYFAKLESLKLAYPCFCSEHELAIARKTALAAHRPPRYSGKCRQLTPEDVQTRRAQGQPATLRFRVEDNQRIEFDDKVRGAQVFQTDDIGDFIIRRSDGTPAFFFCNAIDDALMGVSLVVRGEDHLTNTPRQLMLLKALDLPVPDYAHIALVVGNDGSPLSKRTGSKSVEELRASGYLPSALNNYLARLGHTYTENHHMSLSNLSTQFDLTRLGRAPARYDEAQLLHWQREAVLHLPVAELEAWMGPALRMVVPKEHFDAFVEAVRGNITFPSDAVHWAHIVFTDQFVVSTAAREVMSSAGKEFFVSAREALEQFGTDFKAMSDAVKQARAVNGKSLFRPLRAALLGELDGPEMAKLLPLVGMERARKRLSI